MVGDEEIRIGAHSWRVIVGTGHSPEHACLHCPDFKLLISGDQVLPRISSNVSVHLTEPDADPKRKLLESLAFRTLTPVCNSSRITSRSASFITSACKP